MPHAVYEAVATLIRTQTLRIDITPTVAYTVRAPCLLAQLAEAVGASTGGAGGRTVSRSTPLVAVDALDLWVEITYDTNAWAQNLSIDRTRYREPAAPRHGLPGTPPAGRLLRAVAAQAVSLGKEEIAATVNRKARHWSGTIEAMLTGQVEQRAVRGATCEHCAASTIVEVRDGVDGRPEHYRVPAIVLVVRDDGYGWTLRWLVCRACGWSASVSEPLDRLSVDAA